MCKYCRIDTKSNTVCVALTRIRAKGSVLQEMIKDSKNSRLNSLQT